MFMQTQKMTGKGSDITVIDPDHYLKFFTALRNSKSQDLEFKAFLAIAVSGGCRVSEALSIKAGDINLKGIFKIRVLKKRQKIGSKADPLPIYRYAGMCPDAFKVVRDYITSRKLIATSQLFTFHRATVHRKIKEHFGVGASAHTIARHSHISWLLHSKNFSSERVAAEMEMLTHVIDYYNHANIVQDLEKRFA